MEHGESREELLRRVYPELRALARGLMRGERSNHTLQPTALVHEAFLKIAGETGEMGRTREEILLGAAREMRRILISHGRKVRAQKRGGGMRRESDNLETVPATESEMDLVDEALERLEALDERAARVVELRYFAGLTVAEAAKALGVTPKTVHRDWNFARSWLYEQLQER
jgi:RNA polymerase sigma-70 factor, ECF subfamily